MTLNESSYSEAMNTFSGGWCNGAREGCCLHVLVVDMPHNYTHLLNTMGVISEFVLDCISSKFHLIQLRAMGFNPEYIVPLHMVHYWTFH